MKARVIKMAGEIKFFKNRREMEIGDFHSLKSRGGERRVKVPVRLPLSNRPTKGIPEWVLDGYQFLVKDDSAYNKTSGKKNQKFEGMSVSFFTSEDGVRKMQGVGGLNSCTFDRFTIERVGDTEKAEVFLSFVIYAPCSKDIIIWMYEHQGGSIFTEFDATQATLSYDGKGDEEDEDDGQEKLFESKPTDVVAITGENGIKVLERVIDPNDDPTAPIAGDTRSVTKPTDKPKVKAGNKGAAKKAVAKKSAKK